MTFVGTTIVSVSKAAGVTCPKETGEMRDDDSCRVCDHFEKCYAVVVVACED